MIASMKRTSFWMFAALVGAMLVGCSSSGSAPRKETALHIAARHGSRAEMETALNTAGADINGIDKDNNTALHYAAEFDNLDAATVLVEHGANVNIGDEDQDTPLHFAAQKGSRRVAQYLVQH